MSAGTERNPKRRVICPKCSAKMTFRARKDVALAVTCPKCNERLRLPPLEELGAPPTAPLPPPARPHRTGKLLTGIVGVVAACVVVVAALWAFGVIDLFPRNDGDSTIVANGEGGDSGNGTAGDAIDDTAAVAVDPQAAQAEQILKKNCHQCHGQDGSDEGGLNFILNRDRLVDDGYIIPGDLESSYLFERISTRTMPPDSAEVKPSADEIAILKEWILAGAPDFAAQLAREFISADTVYNLIHQDLEATDPDFRQYIRYFTLTHLYNAEVTGDEIETFRLALSKLVNSLSWERELAPLRPLDPAKTILRVDLRDVQWDDDTWQAIIGADPYALVSTNPNAQKCQELTGCEIPVVRGDWFVHAASVPPLYYRVLGMTGASKPMNFLEEKLNVNVARNIEQRRAQRAGFGKSGVSSNNRLIERHPTAYGAMWVSYDFAGNKQTQNLFDHPLGPDGPNSFQHDGGEVIFNLPNGLQGYLLIDAKGIRLTKGPTEIVSDPRRPDRAVVNGVSCMSCHYNGIIAKRDEIRTTVEEVVALNPDAYSAADLKAIRELYPSAETMQQLQAKDAQRFIAAVEKIGLTRITETAEPVRNMKDRFENDVEPQLAAAELGMTLENFKRQLSARPELARRLSPLLTDKAVKRDLFASEFSKVAEAFGIGTPLDKSDSPGDGGRKWLDVAGKEIAVGDFVDADGDNVTIKKADGSTLKIAFNQLGENDKTFVLKETAKKLEQGVASVDDIPNESNPDVLAGRTPPANTPPVDHEFREWVYKGRPILARYESFGDGRLVAVRVPSGARVRLDVAYLAEADIEYVLSYYPGYRLWTPSPDIPIPRKPFFAKYAGRDPKAEMVLGPGNVIRGTAVKLMLPSGAVDEGPLQFLSKEDQAYVAEQPEAIELPDRPKNLAPRGNPDRRRRPAPGNAPPGNAPPGNAPPGNPTPPGNAPAPQGSGAPSGNAPPPPANGNPPPPPGDAPVPPT